MSGAATERLIGVTSLINRWELVMESVAMCVFNIYISTSSLASSSATRKRGKQTNSGFHSPLLNSVFIFLPERMKQIKNVRMNIVICFIPLSRSPAKLI